MPHHPKGAGTSSEPATASLQDAQSDDHVLPFQTDAAGAIGRVVRLGPVVDEILTQHDYPEPVARALGEALALTAMLGAALKIEGRLILQTSTDGPLRMLVANYDAPGRLRGYASFDDSLRTNTNETLDQGALLGNGHLAMTVDPGGDLDRYQGVVALDNCSLTSAALTYFRQSEQLPTYLRLAVARHFQAGDGAQAKNESTDGTRRWRAGGLLVQHVAREGGKQPHADLPDGRPAVALEGVSSHGLEGDDAENWQRTRLLAATVEDHELIDPTLSSQTLLYRLFHEEGVRVLTPKPLEAFCRCTRERVEAFIAAVPADDLADLREPDGGVTVTCEFCNTAYRFEPDEI